MSEFVIWAEDELRRAGLFDKGSDYEGMLGEAVLKLIHAFAGQGHSGYSADATAAIFAQLSQWKPLTPITNNPNEWMVLDSKMFGRAGTCQSRRQPSLFSEDGGKTYYDIDEYPGRLRKLAGRIRGRPIRKMHTAVEYGG